MQIRKRVIKGTKSRYAQLVTLRRTTKIESSFTLTWLRIVASESDNNKKYKIIC